MATITLRPVDPERDREFLLRVYGESRDDVQRLVDWTPEQKQAFVASQFALQDAYYREHFPEASFDVIEVDGDAAGRLYVDRRDDEIRVIDIALLRAFRRRGVGSHFLRALLDGAGASDRTVTIHVEQDNPALGLYEQLGFRRQGEVGIHWFMEWRPGT